MTGNLTGRWWETINGLTHCTICGQPNYRTRAGSTVGFCKIHLDMWNEDIKSGFRQTSIRDIMVARGQVSNYRSEQK